MKKIKVVHICTSLDGGAGLCAMRIMRATSNLGVDNYALLKNGNPDSHIDLIDMKHSRNKISFYFQKILHHFHIWPRASRIDYQIQKARLKKDIIGYFTSPVTEYRISEHQWISEADIIHLHWVGGFLDYESFFRIVKKPIVWTLHDENPGLGGFHYASWKDKSTTKGQQIDNAMAVIKRKAYNHVKSMNIVAISSMMKDFICKNDLLDRFPCTLIHNGIDENLFLSKDKALARQSLGIKEDRMVFIFVAYNIYDNRKGLKDLLEALERLNIQNTTLICIGQYDVCPTTSFEVLCEGFVSNPRLLSLYYSAADFFIMPSYQEAFAQTPMEAMACGTPVIAYPCSGTTDLIKPFNGIVCTDFTIDALTHAIKKATSKIYDRNEIRQYIIEHFSYNLIGKEYAQLYRNILTKYKEKR